MKRILLGLGAIGITLVMVPMFSAFEAHVVNVTATIENALRVPLKSINFGTVFPQEQLDETLDVHLSQSFIDEPRVDDVDYIIRQKPKCGLPIANTDPVEYSAFGVVTEDGHGDFVCVDDGYVMLPLLCPYLSKHEISSDGLVAENDSAGISAFHGLPGTWNLATTVATQVRGHLAKLQQDFDDLWNIDLKVPCFGGYCAQDWENYVFGINPNVIADDYVQPIANEHEIFGCDLWLEVGGISLPGLGCTNTDTVFVIDSSGSIGNANMALVQTATKALALAMAPSPAGTHIGVVDFDSDATLEQELTDVLASIDAAIDAMVSGGATAMGDGIAIASTELVSVRDRADGSTPDYMVIVTDGVNNTGQDPAAAAAAAKAAGTTLYVVGVGAGVDTNFLQNTIASSPAHYFAAADFDDLELILEGIAQCD